jgi:hypothetical protein
VSEVEYHDGSIDVDRKEQAMPYLPGTRLLSALQRAGSSRVKASDNDRIAGAARRTTGAIATHDTSHEASQFHRKWPVAMADKLAIPAAMKEVNPDWMTPNTKWL